MIFVLVESISFHSFFKARERRWRDLRALGKHPNPFYTVDEWTVYHDVWGALHPFTKVILSSTTNVHKVLKEMKDDPEF